MAALAIGMALSLGGCAAHGPVEAARRAAATTGGEAEDRQLRCRGALDVPPLRVDLHARGGTDRDHRLVCTGAIRAAAFLLASGLRPSLHLRVEFRHAVLFDVTGDRDVGGVERTRRLDASTGDASRTAPADAERIFGMYRRDLRIVFLTTEASPWLRSYTYFGLPMTEEMLTSMVAHEITHALSKSLYAPGLQAPDVDTQVQDQYVAYVVQLATMTPDLREAVLANYPAHLHDFKGEQDINALSLGFSPEAFGVKSYRHFKGQGGGPGFLARVFSGAFRPPAFLDYAY